MIFVSVILSPNILEGVNVIPNSTVEHVSYKDDQVHLRLNNGEEVL